MNAPTISIMMSGKEVIAVLAKAGFTRTARGQMVYEISPGDFVPVSGKNALLAIFEETGKVRADQDYLNLGRGAPLWDLIKAHLFLLPRTGGTPTKVHS